MRTRNWLCIAIAFGFGSISIAHDVDGRYAQANPELHAWFESLRSGKGFCCADADGVSVADVDWSADGDHYKVFLEGDWRDVPPEAVVTVPNKVGKAMVWRTHIDGHPVINCFLPGVMG